MRSGLYTITNSVNGRIYVGSSVDVAARLKKHASRLAAGSHENHKLQSDWLAFGPAAFVFRRIARVPRDYLERAEQRCLNGLDFETHYNLRSTVACGSQTTESRKILSEKRKAWWASKTLEERRAITQSSRDKVASSPEIQATIVSARRTNGSYKGWPKDAYQKTRSPETRAKIAASRLGKKYPRKTP